MRLRSLILFLCFSFTISNLQAQHWVGSVSPGLNANAVDKSAAIDITFTRDILLQTLIQGGLRIHGSLTGFISAAEITYNQNTLTATFTPTAAYKAGETVTVSVTSITHGAMGEGSMPNPYVFQFRVKSAPAMAAFSVSSTVNVGSGADAPYFITAGDFNGDGHVDLATANKSSSTVSILMNDGTGNFSITSNPTPGGTPDAITAADFDNDGFLDLAVPTANNNRMVPLLNNGSGGFSAGAVVVVGNFPHGINSGDLTGDGRADITVSNFNTATISILRNTGGSQFEVSSSPAVNTGAESTIIADFSNDGDLDLAVSHFSTANFIVLENNGGSFSSSTSSLLGSAAHLAGAGDLDNDGWVDAIVSHNGANNLTVLMNDGNGSLVPQPTISQAGAPWSAITCDLDGDGDLDAVTTSYSSSRLFIYENNGEGNLTAKPGIIVGSSPHLAVCADFNGDDALDLAVANDGSNTVSILLNQPTVGIEDDISTAPQEFSLSQNYPNPFNPSTEIRYTLPTASSIQLTIFNIVGEAVKTLVDGQKAAGTYTAVWNGIEDSGKQAASGIYFYQLKVAGDTGASGNIITKRMILMK